VTWDDQVKGLITIGNSELDDLVLMRGDGVPTYNFGVVVDDIDMSITNVIRGDDHVNNTPRQINIYKALGATLPKFAHLPMILGSDGERLSKRHGAVSVMQYRDEGYLADALVNYLARLGWSHGDEEKFSRDQLVEWFDLAHISRSPARFAPEKLQWLNNLYIRDTPDEELADLVEPLIIRSGGDSDDSNKLVKAIGLVKGRAQTINALAEECMLFFHRASPAADLIAQHVTAELRPVLSGLVAQLEELAPWDAATIAATLKQTLAAHKIKMPQLAMPLRVLVFGRTKTPDIANALAIVGKSEVAARIRAYV
jgi:glutamyl-tRNA synthetase